MAAFQSLAISLIEKSMETASTRRAPSLRRCATGLQIQNTCTHTQTETHTNTKLHTLTHSLTHSSTHPLTHPLTNFNAISVQ
jgi:carbohydrate-binding DOMON domain-containing protein